MPTRDSDIEDEVAGYQARMSQLARILYRNTGRALDTLKADLRDMMTRAGYDGGTSSVFLNSMADATTLRRLEELVAKAPEGMRRKAWQDVIDMVANGRMTNRRAMKILSKYSVYSVIDDMLTVSGRILDEVTTDGYLHGVYMLQKSAGFGWAVGDLKGGRMQIIVHSAFSEKDARKFVSVAADMADEQVMYELLKGSPPDKAVAGVDRVKQATQYRSKRAARTMITDTAGMAHRESYERHGVKQYRFTCTYDERTCPVCGSMDGRRFPVSEAKAGTNYPPMHPNCRCTTVAVLSKEIEAAMAPRAIRDRSTGRIVDVPQDFTYEDWYKRFGPGRTDGHQYIPKKR